MGDGQSRQAFVPAGQKDVRKSALSQAERHQVRSPVCKIVRIVFKRRQSLHKGHQFWRVFCVGCQARSADVSGIALRHKPDELGQATPKQVQSAS